jgi:hypothetical protein
MTVTSLGQFVVGERPDPLEVTFKDADGVPIDITGLESWFSYQRQDDPPVVVAAAIADGPGGVLRHTWTDFTTAGLYRGEAWVGTSAGVKRASQRYTWRVKKALLVPTFA